MKIVQISIENFKGIKDKVEITTNDFNCIVGKNDVGKSTVLKALDIFLNDKSPSREDKNAYVDSTSIMIELTFEINTNTSITIDEAIPTTFIEEELLNERGQLVIKKVWNVANDRPKVEWFIERKSYGDNDFLFLTETNLMKLCKDLGIETTKGNNQEYNNVEKRKKLRDFCKANSYNYSYQYTPLPTTGQTRQKKVFDTIKLLLPSFEYFKADTSLSETDTSIQNYFKKKALNALNDSGVSTNDLEETIRSKVEESLSKITTLINSIVPDEEHITANIDFDWSKLISTTFKSEKENINIPLSSRGDGFRRITMMSYFEMLAEETKGDKNIIFGFEEPETFLHPQVQKQLFEKLTKMTEVGYQIFTTTHSPIIVAETNTSSILFIQKTGNNYTVCQKEKINIKTIVEELGIKADDEIIKLHENIKLLFLVEGKDDVAAFKHISKLYKENGFIKHEFDELGVHIIPLGSKDNVQHWMNLEILKHLGRQFYIVLDSDKDADMVNSPNKIKLIANWGLKEKDDFHILSKRTMENYIPYQYFHNITNPVNIEYNDFDKVKDICARHEGQRILGGKSVLSYHFKHLDINYLRMSFCPDGINDEFLKIYDGILQKMRI